MDRDYMLYAIRTRLEQLSLTYKRASVQKDIYGNKLSYSNARAIRYNCKKDIHVLRLIELLLESCSIDNIDDQDIINAFKKLVEPRVLRSKQ